MFSTTQKDQMASLTNNEKYSYWDYISYTKDELDTSQNSITFSISVQGDDSISLYGIKVIVNREKS